MVNSWLARRNGTIKLTGLFDVLKVDRKLSSLLLGPAGDLDDRTNRRCLCLGPSLESNIQGDRPDLHARARERDEHSELQ